MQARQLRQRHRLSAHQLRQRHRLQAYQLRQRHRLQAHQLRQRHRLRGTALRILSVRTQLMPKDTPTATQQLKLTRVLWWQAALLRPRRQLPVPLYICLPTRALALRL
jgi:hypothetical protein